MKIYISGKISGLDKEESEFRFSMAKNRLGQDYEEIINPLDLRPFLGIKCWLCYMITDLYHLRKCTHIAMQNNWTKSKGAVIEYFFAQFFYKLQIIWL